MHELVESMKDDSHLRLRTFLSREDAMDVICANVANGGSVRTIAKVLNVRASDLNKWLRMDPRRSERYEQALSDRTELERENLLSVVRDIAMFDVKSLFDDDGNVLPVSEWPHEASTAIAGIDISERFDKEGSLSGVSKKLKLADRVKVVEMLGREHNLFTNKKEISGTLTLEDLITGDDE